MILRRLLRDPPIQAWNPLEDNFDLVADRLQARGEFPFRHVGFDEGRLADAFGPSSVRPPLAGERLYWSCHYRQAIRENHARYRAVPASLCLVGRC